MLEYERAECDDLFAVDFGALVSWGYPDGGEEQAGEPVEVEAEALHAAEEQQLVERQTAGRLGRALRREQAVQQRRQQRRGLCLWAATEQRVLVELF